MSQFIVIFFSLSLSLFIFIFLRPIWFDKLFVSFLFFFPITMRPDFVQPYIEEIFTRLRGDIFRKFVESDKYTRFCQWKNLELNIQVPPLLSFLSRFITKEAEERN